MNGLGLCGVTLLAIGSFLLALAIEISLIILYFPTFLLFCLGSFLLIDDVFFHEKYIKKALSRF